MHVDRLVVIRRLRPGLCDCFSHMSTNKSSHCVLLVTRFCRNPLELRVFQGSVSLTEFLCGEGRESACVHAVSPSFNSNTNTNHNNNNNTNTPVYGGGQRQGHRAVAPVPSNGAHALLWYSSVHNLWHRRERTQIWRNRFAKNRYILLPLCV